MRSRVLVTGAGGFVGRRLCAELSGRGHEVRAAVRAAPDAGVPGCHTVALGDLQAFTPASSAALGSPDVLIHLAARVHVMHETAGDPLAAFRAINVDATRALALAAARERIKRFVYVSSVKVNGEATSGHPFDPSDPPRPQDPYAVSKCEAEEALWRIAGDTGLEVVVVRPPLVYGPGVAGNFRRLLSALARGVPLPLASVANRRSMIYNGNLASALIACATHARAAGQTFLVRDGEDLSTPDLLCRLGRHLGRPARLLHCPPALLSFGASAIRRGEEMSRLIGSLQVDDTKLRRELAWEPPFAVDEGLAHTARWFLAWNSERARSVAVV